MEDRFKFRVWNKNQGAMLQNICRLTDYDENHLIILQCTGLKDSNGKLIYEGDIVDITVENEVRGRIEWEKEQAKFIISTDENYVADFDNYWAHDLEVIANIYENPEFNWKDRENYVQD